MWHQIGGKMKYVVLTMGILFCLTSVVFADEVVYDASQDTEVDEQLSGMNAGDYQVIEVHADWEDEPVWIVKCLFEFPIDIPYGEVMEAVLQLHVVGNTLDPGPIDIFRVGEPWAEMTVTWDTRPGENRVNAVTEEAAPPGTPEMPALWEIDVTHIVQEWVHGFPNHGFYLDVPDNNNWVSVDLATREHPDADIRPKLWINYWYNNVAEEAVDNMTLSVSPISAGSASINFSLPASASATLSVYDATGSLVQNFTIDSGTPPLTYTGDAGVYFVRLATPAGVLTGKLVLIN
jgi:hypothetical protein